MVSPSVHFIRLFREFEGVGEISNNKTSSRITLLMQPGIFLSNREIKFSIPSEAHVTLGIYDILGRCIRTLVDGEVASGVHQLTWDGMNNYNRRIATGVYFCVLKINGHFEKSVKMILIQK